MAEDCLHSGGPIIGQCFAEKSGKRRMRGGGFDPCGNFFRCKVREFFHQSRGKTADERRSHGGAT